MMLLVDTQDDRKPSISDKNGSWLKRISFCNGYGLSIMVVNVVRLIVCAIGCGGFTIRM